jgi:hypothetical protein
MRGKMNIEDMTTIIEETIEETRQDLEATGHFIQSVIGIALQVMTALQSVNFQVSRPRALENNTLENEIEAKILDKVINLLKDEEHKDQAV